MPAFIKKNDEEKEEERYITESILFVSSEAYAIRIYYVLPKVFTVGLPSKLQISSKS